MWPILIPSLIGAGTAFLANRQNVREAEKSRQFQKEMSDSAHQREVADLRRAGLNPVLSAHGSGASSPSGAQARVEDIGEGASRGIASALAIRQAKAQIDLTNAQAAAANAAGQESNARAGVITQEAAAGRYELIRQQVRSGQLDLAQKEKLLPLLLERAKSETASAKAISLLDQMAIAQGANLEKLEKQLASMGAAGPWMRLLLEFFRASPPSRTR